MQRVFRAKELVELIGISRASIWRLEKSGLFPRRKKIGLRAVGWLAEDIEQWLSTRPLAREEKKEE
jgi:prophage regulatory protein|uniref:AlpA family phage regulatory protein n=1 Tax=Desulfobacca acetoxidans TaxID=60893 RepID=A0A7C3WL42_9BACT